MNYLFWIAITIVLLFALAMLPLFGGVEDWDEMFTSAPPAHDDQFQRVNNGL